MVSPLIVASQPLFFAGFLLFVILGLAADLGVFAKHVPHVLSFREALTRTIGWVSAGLAFAAVIYFFYADICGFHSPLDLSAYKNQYNSHFTLTGEYASTRHGFSVEVFLQYLTGYFIEYSLSIDNLFVIMLIFTSFGVKEEYRKDILFWGVLGAVIMRFIFIFAGSALLTKFHWLMYIFGAILIYSGFKMLVKGKDKDETIDTDNHGVVKFVRKLLPVSVSPHGGQFFIREEGKLYFTGLFVVLVVIECTDVVFAVDSVPAIFSITRDPYLVFFSNIFAIMGLRSLYFLLSHSLEKIHTLKYGLSVILIFIGTKMIFEKWFNLIGFNHIHNLLVLLSIIAGTLFFAWVLPSGKSKAT